MNISEEKMMASTSGTSMENRRLAGFSAKLGYGLILFTVIGALSGAATARDRGINQPGPAGGTAGVGAPGVGAVDPGINQPGAAGNVGRRGVGAPGVGVADPGINQPGAAGNVGGAGVGRDPGINQPGAAGNRGRVVR
jgi:hypothetical protein